MQGRSENMQRLILAAAVVFAGSVSYAAGGYWVVGNRATGKCDIVTSNPVIGGGSAYDNGKLARSTIGVCPPPEPEKASAGK
jgi:hypothetical protein